MLSARFRPIFSKTLEKLAPRVNPNLLTISSLFLMPLYLFLCLKSFGILAGSVFLLALLIDSLDGAAARKTGRVSKGGSYLDAMIDRIVDGLGVLGLYLLTGHPIECFLLLLVSLLISYAKARAAMEVPVDNIDWPDLMERAERGIFLAAILIVQDFFPSVVLPAIYILLFLSFLTLLQRAHRAWVRINEHIRKAK